MGRRAYLPVVAIVALLAAGLGLWAAAPAFAAPKPIGLSADGVTFSDALPASIFAGARIVPGTELTRPIWVMNRETTPGNLAIALQGVTGADHALVAALFVKADAGPRAGHYIAFPSANPCRSVLSAVALAPGAIVQVDVTLKLNGSLHSHTSQGSVGSFDLRLSLTSVDVAAPDGCSPVTSPPNGGGGGGGGGNPPAPPGEIDSTIVSGAADGAIPDEGGLPDLSGSGDGVAAAIIQPNTSRFFQEFFIVGWLVAVVLGGIFAGWRRRRDPEDEYA
jgi:hypothetical protein